GLFRYGLISDALDEALSTKQRGRLVRALAARSHPGPFGTPVRGLPRHPGPLDPGLPGRRLRGAGPDAAAGPASDAGAGAGAGGGAEDRGAGPDRGAGRGGARGARRRSEEHTSELQSLAYLVCRLLLEK